MTTLYKRSKLGKIQKWSIETEGGKFRTHEGFVDGKVTIGEWTSCVPKNVGTKIETSPEDQAVKEAFAKFTKKKEQGYTEYIENVDMAAKKISPMLAHKWDDYKDKLKSLWLISQPKLDGIRCIATEDGLFTRNGKQILSVPHLEEEIKILQNLISDVTPHLDGELYNHDLKADFNQITSIVRKSAKITEEDFSKAEKIIQYHIYDVDNKNSNKTFTKRYLELRDCFNSYSFTYLKLVPVYGLMPIEQDPSHRYKEMDMEYGKYLEDGYEGQMIRLPNSLYENSRSKSLLKRKEFIDEEFEITDVEEGLGNRSGMMGRVKFKMKDGKTFDASARGNYDYYKELLINKENYIGKFGTVRYQNLTPDGIPRFPVMIDIREND